MLFGKKDKIECEFCGEKVNKKYTFCPHCGEQLYEEDPRDMGMLGESDMDEVEMPLNMGITEKMLGSLVNSLMKNLDKELKNMNKSSNTEIKNLPNGIKISIGSPMSVQKKAPRVEKKEITKDQMEKITSLPKTAAKTNVKRLSDKVIYELSTPGVNSTEDIFISKLESGYEIKAIGNKKVYVNSIPLNLPLKSYSLKEEKVSVEFKPEH